MIEFDCEHCGKKLHSTESYAGRDGWCRVCKHMVIVPSGDRVVHLSELSREEGFERLQRLLQYAATKADRFKAHLAQQASEERQYADQEEALRHAKGELNLREVEVQAARKAEAQAHDALEKLLEESTAQISSLEARLAAAATSADGDSAQRQEQLQSARQEVAELHETLAGQGTELTQMRDALDRETAATAEATESIAILQAERDAAQAETTRLNKLLDALKQEQPTAASHAEMAELEASLSAAREARQKAETELESLKTALADHTAREANQAATLARQQAEIENQARELADLRARQEERETHFADQLQHLQDQVALFGTLKERMTGLQEKLKGLDQERLDLSLALEDAQRQGALDVKKHASLEERLDRAADEKARFLVRIEDLERDGTCKDEQIKQLRDELQRLTAGRSAAELRHDREHREVQAAEERAAALAEELATAKQNLETEAAAQKTLQEALAEAHERHKELEARLDEKGDAARDRNRALLAAEERIATLESTVEDVREEAAQHRAEAERLALALNEANERSRIRAEEPAAEVTFTGGHLEPDDGDPDEGTRRDDREEVETIVLTEQISESQRRRERQQMMDVLSDFLDK